MGRLAEEKHSSLLRRLVNSGLKKFYSIGPWQAGAEVVEAGGEVNEAVAIVDAHVAEEAEHRRRRRSVGQNVGLQAPTL
jgi:hypothetical protein